MADWWSFGILLYEMVKGTTPWSHTKDRVDILESLQKGKIEITQGSLSNECFSLIQNLLKINPTQRLGHK